MVQKRKSWSPLSSIQKITQKQAQRQLIVRKKQFQGHLSNETISLPIKWTSGQQKLSQLLVVDQQEGQTTFETNRHRVSSSSIGHF